MSMTGQEFEAALMTTVTRLCREAIPGVCMDSDTPLFEGGVLDSVRFIEVLAFVEVTLGIEVPTELLTMEHFRTVAVIAATFYSQAYTGLGETS